MDQISLYITPGNQIYSGDNLDNDRKLTDAEVALFMRGSGYEINDEGFLVDVIEDPEYLAKELLKAKNAKVAELLTRLKEKSGGLTSTININLPATLKKGDEVKNVTSYKLLSNTSGGNLLGVIQNLKDLPGPFLTDMLVTVDGYTILGLAQEVTQLGMTKSQAYFIWLTILQVQGQITEYLRDTKDAIMNAESIEALNAIEISFEEF